MAQEVEYLPSKKNPVPSKKIIIIACVSEKVVRSNEMYPNCPK
jgi:hypothetical protein